ncbi:MAG: MOSC domain-containing protein [Desulfobacteraceae bacterium]|nr:MOSC domain-containing protein [Desulfobacteraceae bacterium]
MKILAINISRSKGTRKNSAKEADLVTGYGINGDAHAGDWHRQVSFLAEEAIDTARSRGLEVTFGDFAENITTRGIEWETLPVGTRLEIGDTAMVEITQIGKECHKPCAIYYKAGDCIMPAKGVFAKVIKEGTIRTGDYTRLCG